MEVTTHRIGEKYDNVGSRDRKIEVTTHRGERKPAVWVVEIEKQKLLPTGEEKTKDMLPVLLLH